MGCCLCHPILNSGLLSTPRLVVRAGAILAWIQPTQHFGLSPAVTEPRLQLSMPDAGVRMPSLAVPSQLSWAMGKLAAALAGRDSQPIPMEAAVCLAGRCPV